MSSFISIIRDRARAYADGAAGGGDGGQTIMLFSSCAVFFGDSGTIFAEDIMLVSNDTG